MTLRELLYVFGTKNLLRIVNRQQETIGYGLVSDINMYRDYLMDNEVLSVNLGMNLATEESYILIELNV